MSAKQASLKHPATIAVVAVLLVAVVFLNVNTFGKGGRKPSRGYRVQAHPPVPMDAGKLASYSPGRSVLDRKPVQKYSTDQLRRDPFYQGKNRPKPMAGTMKKQKTNPKAALPKIEPLACSTIMLGGIKPMAIVNGEARFLGEKIRGMTVTNIDADGVTLLKVDGSRVLLPMGVQDDENQTFRVVTRTRESNDQGRTHLVENNKEGNPK
jgi:hypothetical protein